MKIILTNKETLKKVYSVIGKKDITEKEMQEVTELNLNHNFKNIIMLEDVYDSIKNYYDGIEVIKCYDSKEIIVNSLIL